jgi:hypothetical protein
MTVLGLYTGDLIIPFEGITLQQLVVMFLIEGGLTDPYRSITLQVSLPDTEPRMQPIPLEAPVTAGQGRTTMAIRYPFLIPQPILRSGRIETKVIHEKGELIAGYQWISTQEQIAVK